MPFIWEPFPYFKIVSSAAIVVVTFRAPSKVERAVKVNTSKTWVGPLGAETLSEFCQHYLFFFLFIISFMFVNLRVKIIFVDILGRYNIQYKTLPPSHACFKQTTYPIWWAQQLLILKTATITINIFFILLSSRMLLMLPNYLWYIEDILFQRWNTLCAKCSFDI